MGDKQMGYGQHQSFYLRDRWLNKALKELKADNRFFYDDEAFEKIGLGKNMIQSLRHWVVATGIVNENFNEDRKKIHIITELGELINIHDKYLRYPDTVAVLHYHLSKEREPATTWYWFFNIFNERSTTKEDLLNRLNNWVDKNEERKISINSLKRDIDCLIKLYTSGENEDDPEEVIQSSFDKLKIIQEKNGEIYKRNGVIENIGLGALMYVLLDFKMINGVESITVDEIVQRKSLWGKIYNMERTTVVQALESLSTHHKYNIKFTRTNNLDTIRLPDITPLEYLNYFYSRKVEG